MGRAPMPTLHAGRGLLEKLLSLCELVQLPSSSRYSFWHQDLRLSLHLCVVVCLAWSRTQQSRVSYHHSPPFAASSK